MPKERVRDCLFAPGGGRFSSLKFIPHHNILQPAAHCADVFTTVSRITAYEAEYILKRKPNGVVPNGLNTEVSSETRIPEPPCASKAKINNNNFIRGHFYGHYDFNGVTRCTCLRLDGVDILVESLAYLNYQLQKSGHT
ncbi:uncharacterized protein FOMMEDRAFT_159404 [Fomitiporia mediterranea MF3/22]|uniref:uncharacterized protein n=1 Tax=Fomitiporia mediterranea (strain MF3/22) TaxID=694068 RepID=UPI0004409747|nr:uncharacterized protein FOMMEDRAFT_159404 [Fomitiporia mediterranea MF3/22]EJD00640.1 hypothetical protein FOMMEDRAFT_159404 [Fomitiporia mediterranea MF3/22]